jgi:hypothetical protein
VKKNTAAVALGKRRWKNVEPEARSEIGRAAAKSRWENATEEERAELGKKLADARAAARKAGKKK